MGIAEVRETIMRASSATLLRQDQSKEAEIQKLRGESITLKADAKKAAYERKRALELKKAEQQAAHKKAKEIQAALNDAAQEALDEAYAAARLEAYNEAVQEAYNKKRQQCYEEAYQECYLQVDDHVFADLILESKEAGNAFADALPESNEASISSESLFENKEAVSSPESSDSSDSDSSESNEA